MSKTKKHYTPEERKEAVAKVNELRQTKNAQDACKEVGVAYGSYMNWSNAKKAKKKKTKRIQPTAELAGAINALVQSHPQGQQVHGQQSQTKKRRPVMFFAGDADDIKDVLGSMGLGFQQ